MHLPTVHTKLNKFCQTAQQVQQKLEQSTSFFSNNNNMHKLTWGWLLNLKFSSEKIFFCQFQYPVLHIKKKSVLHIAISIWQKFSNRSSFEVGNSLIFCGLNNLNSDNFYCNSFVMEQLKFSQATWWSQITYFYP